MNELAGATLAIATHVYGSGPADALEEYACDRAERVLVFRHAFSYARRVDSDSAGLARKRSIRSSTECGSRSPSRSLYKGTLASPGSSEKTA